MITLGSALRTDDRVEGEDDGAVVEHGEILLGWAEGRGGRNKTSWAG